MNMQCDESIDKNDQVDNVSADTTEAMQLDMDEIVVKSPHPAHGAIYECDR